MTERYGSGHGDEGQRPSGRGSVTERLARQPHGARDIDLTDEAADRHTADDQAGRDSPGTFEPAEDRPGSSSIFDVDERARREDLHPTGYEPPVADPDADGPRGETTLTEPGEVRSEPGAGGEATDITPTPVPVAEPPAEAPAPHGLPEPGATGAPATPADAQGSLPGSLDVGELRSRFLEIQAGFVDEPRQAVEEAGRFADDLVRQVADVIQRQRGQLGGASPEGSTEDLRLTLRAYRQFVDRLLGLAS